MAMLDRKMVGEASRTNATVIITNVGSVLKVGGFQCTYTPYICILQISIALGSLKARQLFSQVF